MARAGERVYLDYNATAPIRPEVVAAVAEALGEVGNPSSVHAAGRRARGKLERARELIAGAAGADPDGLVFTSGGTEANHLALAQAREGLIAVSAIEHPSVLRHDGQKLILPVDRSGRLDVEAAQALIAARRPALVSVMLANNETGVLQPVSALVPVCREAGALLHVDAVQALGKVPLSLEVVGADLMSLSAHKIGGPPGVGALACRPATNVRPVLTGGAQEQRRRAGTENLPAIIGFAAAVTAMRAAEPAGWATLRHRLEAAIDAEIVGIDAPRLPNTCCILNRGVRADIQLMALDLEGVMVSAGSACSSGRVGPSHVLEAMGYDSEAAGAAIRVSLGWATTEADIDRFIASYSKLGTLARRAPMAT